MHPSESPGTPTERTLPQRVFSAFYGAMHANRQLMMRKVGQHGTHPAQMFCLAQIAHHEGITQRDLAEMMQIARPTLTVMLQKMEKAGLIERRTDPDDQRFTRIYLAEKGHAVHEQAHEVIAGIVDDAIGKLSEHDQLELERLLGLLTENMAAAAAVDERADA